jgi:hypothetical protein
VTGPRAPTNPFLAGLSSGIRGIGAGLVNGATAWGLFFLISIAAVLPGAFTVNARLRESFAAIDDAGTSELTTGLWTGFWSLLIGAALALAGGAIGGLVRRPVRVSAVAGAEVQDAEVRSVGYPRSAEGRSPETEDRYPDASGPQRATDTPADRSSRR